MAGLRLLLALVALCVAGQAGAQTLTALARVDASASGVERRGDGARLTLALSQPVPWRVFTLDGPPRLVLDFSAVAWDGVGPADFALDGAVDGASLGVVRPGWSRMVLHLAAPLAVTEAGMDTTRTARVTVDLRPTDAAAFAAAAGTPPSALFDLPRPARVTEPARRYRGDRPLRVVLDPGHGGIDPGAERGGAVEAQLMLQFARELREVLLRAGGFEVTLTREGDDFVPLESRQSIARAARADVFLSLHADALAEGRAEGATIYTLSAEASDVASAKLAERHDRADLLAGVDLTHHDDAVAGVLMDLARTETAPRNDRLADALVEGLRENIGSLHKRPRLAASFSVLKAPDIPSVLVELGFMSSARDLENLQSPEWRARAARGIAQALQDWAAADAAEADLLRQ